MVWGKAVPENACCQPAQLVMALSGVRVTPGDKSGSNLFTGALTGAADDPARTAAPVAPDPACAGRINSGAGGAVLRAGAPAPARPALLVMVLAGAPTAAAGETEFVTSPPALAAWAANLWTAIDLPYALAPVALQFLFIVDKRNSLVPEFSRMATRVPVIFSRLSDLYSRRSEAFANCEMLRDIFTAFQVLFAAKDSQLREISGQEQAPPPFQSARSVESPGRRRQLSLAEPGVYPFLQRNLTQWEPLSSGIKGEITPRLVRKQPALDVALRAAPAAPWYSHHRRGQVSFRHTLHAR